MYAYDDNKLMSGYWSGNGKYVSAPEVQTNPSTGEKSTVGYFNGCGKYVPGQKLQPTNDGFKTQGFYMGNGKYQQGFHYPSHK